MIPNQQINWWSKLEMIIDNSFVFAVCGGKEHTDTLKIALEFLTERTVLPIFIVTDNRRNEEKVEGDRLIDTQTPIELSNHEAAIWLKTSLHRILPKGRKYMYLDTDVLAIGNNIDSVFDEFIPPIIFAADHCKMMQFSPYALNCNCLAEVQEYRKKINSLMNEADPLRTSNNVEIIEKRKRLEGFYKQLHDNFLLKVFATIRYIVSGRNFKLYPDILFDRKEKIWKTPEGDFIMKSLDMTAICKAAGLKWNKLKLEPQLPDGRNIWQDHCSHLQDNIHKVFDIQITQKNWQHWNGGVFLFSDESYDFLETWHQYTLQIFKDSKWKTRDQGTLIATVWKFSLQNQAMLHPRWNCIADYHNKALEIGSNGKEITLNGKDFFMPQFIHIYHHFGDETWNIWNWTIKHSKFSNAVSNEFTT